MTIRFIHMVDRSLGWAFGGPAGSDDLVLLTRSGGETWLDVTPPVLPNSGAEKRLFVQGNFIDAQTAWIVEYDYPKLAGGDPPVSGTVVVWRTGNGGQEWASSSFEVEFLYGMPQPFMGFTDKQNGWILVRLGPAGMHKYPAHFFTTRDGGSHWDDAAFLYDCHKTGLVFADSQTGWLTHDQCPYYEPYISWTRDGGLNWARTVLPNPDEDRDSVNGCGEMYSPHLFSSSSGLLTVDCTTFDTASGSTSHDYFLYSTNDGGQTWSITSVPGESLVFINANVGWALGRDLYQTLDGGQTWTFLKTVNWDGQFSFVDEQVGWAVARAEDKLALVQTTDGGRTWTLLSPQIGP